MALDIQPHPTQWARALWAAGEPFVLGMLFSAEVRQVIDDLGIPARTGYFAIRTAPLGRASSAVSAAALHGFPPALVDTMLTPVWDVVSPEALISAHHASIPRTAQRVFGDNVDAARLSRLADVLTEVVGVLGTAGRPLAAGNQAIDAPTEPWARFWHACTTLREYRGDAHIAALLTADLDVVESLVLASAWAAPYIDSLRLRSSRRISDQEWAQASARLGNRHLLTGEGTLTDLGRQVRADIETLTDRASLRAWNRLTAPQCQELHEVLTFLSGRMIQAGGVGAVTPVGAPWPPPPLTR